MRASPQSIPRDVLKSEAKSLLIFATVYGVGVWVHYQFDSPKTREVVRQVMYAAALALICYLLVVLFRFRSLKAATEKKPNQQE